MKLGGGKRKGGVYERTIAKRLSLWWTGDEDDSVFWRTAISGGRATVRGRKGKSTAGQYGDLSATDPSGKPLLSFVTFELKSGYSAKSVADLLDCPSRSALQQYEEWFNKAQFDAQAAKSTYWCLISCRNKREDLIFFPRRMMLDLIGAGCLLLKNAPRFDMTLDLRNAVDDNTSRQDVVGMHLNHWLGAVSPDAIKGLVGE